MSPTRGAAGRRAQADSAAERGFLVVRVRVVPAVAEPVHYPLASADGRSGHAADRADQRVGRAVPGVLVRLGGGLELVAHRGAGVRVAARVVAGQDVAVLALGRPAVQLGEPDDRERVRRADELEQLDQALAHIGYAVVLARLLEERVVAKLGELRTAGQFHQRAAPGGDVLAGQQ